MSNGAPHSGEPKESGEPKAKKKKDPLSWLSPLMWHGMTMGVWLPLLARNRFAIRPSRWPLATIVTGCSLLNSSMRLLSEAVFGRAAERTKIAHPPLFVIGHWRSGTTLLHELMVLDEQFGYPTTCQCTIPDHFLLNERLSVALLGLLVPKSRAMDNMAFGPDRPQEDEIALCNLGAPSPYSMWAFPNRQSVPRETLELIGLPEREIERWKEKMLWFLKRQTYKDPRRIVLKSPTHTARIKTLLEIFPDAQFVHIARDPFVVFQSTIRTWTSICDLLGLQSARDDLIEEQVLDAYDRMYRCYLRDRELLGPRQLHEVHYEELVSDPIATIGGIYDRLQLGEFEAVRPKIAAFFEGSKDYRPSKYRLDEKLRRKITDRWGEYFGPLGYELQESDLPASSGR